MADEWRYFCMMRPTTPRETEKRIGIIGEDPLNQLADLRRKQARNTTQITILGR